MPKISVSHQSTIKAQSAIEKIKSFFETDQELQRMDSKLSCQFKDGELKGNVTGSQFKANVSVADHAQGSTVQIDIDLPLILTPFKGKVEEMIKKKLAKYLA